MFTGIIEATGCIRAIKRSGSDAVITIDSGQLDLSDVKLGDSIACNGVCLTVTALSGRSFSADISGETLQRTTFATAKVASQLNLEKALLLSTRLGGHLVSGHVDGVGKVVAKVAVGKATEFWLAAPTQISQYIAEKGSITVDGISLTVNAVTDDQFKLTIVPHTSGQTTIDRWGVGTEVNLEVDIIARYVERLITGGQRRDERAPPGVTLALLANSGFIK